MPPVPSMCDSSMLTEIGQALLLCARAHSGTPGYLVRFQGLTPPGAMEKPAPQLRKNWQRRKVMLDRSDQAQSGSMSTPSMCNQM